MFLANVSRYSCDKVEQPRRWKELQCTTGTVLGIVLCMALKYAYIMAELGGHARRVETTSKRVVHAGSTCVSSYC